MTTCNCTAYRFPHRHEGGACASPIPISASERGDPPACSSCQYGETMRDPYGTGDRWYSLTECKLDYCPWGKK